MIGVILVTASALLFAFEGKSLRVLGFNRPRRRVTELAVGFAVAARVEPPLAQGLAAKR